MRNATLGCRLPRPFHRITTVARDLAVFSDRARGLNNLGSKPTVDSIRILYQPYPPSPSGLTRDQHLRLSLKCVSHRTSRCLKAPASSPAPSQKLLTTTR